MNRIWDFKNFSRTVLVLLFVLVNLNDAIKLKCVFKELPNFGKTCVIENVSLALVNISEPIDFDGNLKEKVNTKLVSFLDSNVEFVPSAIFTQFPNINGLGFSNSKINIANASFFKGSEIISRLDLKFNRIQYLPDDIFKHLPKLEMIKLYGNQLEIIGRNLFKENTNLIFIDIQQNDVNMIDHRIFDDIPNLKYFWIKGNPCHSDNFEIKSKEQLEKMKNSLKQCFQNFQTSGALYKTLKKLELKGMDKALIDEFKVISIHIQSVDGNLTAFKKEMEDVKAIDSHLNRIDKKLLMYHEDGRKNRQESFQTLGKKLDNLRTSEWKMAFGKLDDLGRNLQNIAKQVYEVKDIKNTLNKMNGKLSTDPKDQTEFINWSNGNRSEIEGKLLQEIKKSIKELNSVISKFESNLEIDNQCRNSNSEADEKDAKSNDDKWEKNFKDIKKLLMIGGGLLIAILLVNVLVMCCICSVLKRQENFYEMELAFQNMAKQNDNCSTGITM